MKSLLPRTRNAKSGNRSGTFSIRRNTASESMFAFNLAWIKRNGFVLIVRFTTRQGQQLVIQPLMRPYGLYLYALIFENLVELFRICAVVITSENLACKTLFGNMVQEYPSLVFHPTPRHLQRKRQRE